jgi:hypothetical protein
VVARTLTLESFAPLVGSPFLVESGGTSVPLVLRWARARGETAFVLSFAGPAAPLLEQATYRFTHDSLGAFDLFISPRAREADGLVYEALFNRPPPVTGG